LLKVTVPASTSNLGPGFDTFGLALNIYMKVHVELKKASESLKISAEGINHRIPLDKSNLIYRTIELFSIKFNRRIPGLDIHIINEIPLNGGLGASGSAIVAGALIANEIFNLGLSSQDMINTGIEIEGHPDNVSASMLGGFTVNCRDRSSTWHTKSFKIYGIKVIAVIPEIKVDTVKARKILPRSIPMEDAIRNIENASFLLSSLISGDVEGLRFAMSDFIHERYRKKFIPGFDHVREAGIRAGALSVNISGSGSTVVAFATGNEREIGEEMVKAFLRSNVNSYYKILEVDNRGAVIEHG
jgi:homoserine kinase